MTSQTPETAAPETAARATVAAYYASFNAGDAGAMLALVTDDLRHDVNQGAARHGREKFAEFLAHMDRCYSERLEDLVIMVEPSGAHAAARFTVHGAYKATDEGLPEATGQRYVLDAGAFLELRDGRVSRVATCYNLADWIAQVSA